MNPTLIGSGVGTDPRHDPFCSASRRGIFAENAYAFSFSPIETTLLSKALPSRTEKEREGQGTTPGQEWAKNETDYITDPPCRVV
jgi:hypothetical protein